MKRQMSSVFPVLTENDVVDGLATTKTFLAPKKVLVIVISSRVFRLSQKTMSDKAYIRNGIKQECLSCM